MSKRFSWEQEYKRTWEDPAHRGIGEFIRDTDAAFSNNRKGVIRHFHVVVDTSVTIDKSCFLPTFRTNIAKILEEFVPSFYAENPLSVLSFLSARDVSERYCSDADIDVHEFLGQTGSGWFSLLNGLEASVELMRDVSYVKEILVITASISTRDPGGYTEVLERLKRCNIKVHFISLCGEVTLFKSISRATDGRFNVPVDLGHFASIMGSFCYPSDFYGSTVDLIRLGFPRAVDEANVCSCHLEVHSHGYECPVCSAFVCSLPVLCPICGAQLVSTLNLIRSYHFLYPLEPFSAASGARCRICSSEGRYECGRCHSPYCDACNRSIHNNLNFCVFCDEHGE
jgi:transcription initiation factor TFIIH subunit 2